MDEDDTGWELVQTTEETTGTVNESRSCGHMNDLSGVGVNPVRFLQTDSLAPGSSKDDWIYPMGELPMEFSGDRYDNGKSVDLDSSNENDDSNASTELNSDENDDLDSSNELNLDENDDSNASIEPNLDENEDLDASNDESDNSNASMELNWDETEDLDALIELNLDETDDLDVKIELNLDENDSELDNFDGIETVVVKSEDSVDKVSNSDEVKLVEMKSGESDFGEDAIVEADKPITGEEKRKNILWWKTPINFFKCCGFRFKLIWALSVVAAVMGVVIFQRRSHRLKNKSQGLKLKVTTDMNRETRLLNDVVQMNEKFSVVRRIPVMRPSLPAAGVTVTWSKMGSR